MSDTRESWRSQRLNAAAYDAAVERPRIARLFGAAMWATDTRRMFQSVASLAELPPGSSVLDIPCGGGLAFRGLRPDHGLTYVAADISPYMLGRAEARAAADGVEGITYTEADALNLQFDDDAFDYVVTFNGLHCLPEQAPALAEMNRVLRPGGELIGCAVVRDIRARSNAIIRLFQRRGWFGEVTTADELRASFATAGFTDLEFELDGALSHFRARKPGDGVE